MSGKYVPPSKRAGYVTSSTSDLPPPGPSIRSPRIITQRPQGLLPSLTIFDLKSAFNHPQTGTMTFYSYDDPPIRHTRHPRPSYDPSGTPLTIPLPPSPLPPSPPHPLSHLISYISIFPFAHPDWNTHHELWAHTGSQVIIDDFKGDKKNFRRPIPVIRTRNAVAEIFFEGWWIIDDIIVVEPYSEMLTEMMRIKEEGKAFGKNGRTSQAWRDSLSQRWIKIHLLPAPASSEFYTELKDIKSLGKGDGEKYLLEIAGFKDEIQILELANMERKLEMERELEASRQRRLNSLNAIRKPILDTSGDHQE